MPKPVPGAPLWTVPPPEYYDDGDRGSLVRAISGSVEYYSRISPDHLLHFGGYSCKASTIKDSLEALAKKASESAKPETLASYVASNFISLAPSAPSTLLTGYYEGSLKGSRIRHGKYQYPLYSRPNDLITVDIREFTSQSLPEGFPTVLRGRLEKNGALHPFYTREEIDYKRKLAHRGLELLYVDDPIALFFLHIQGSGVVQLENGSQVHMNYAETNGRAYKPIGKLFINKGLIPRENVTMQTIVSYLRAHPDQLQQFLSYNESYVFFREVKDGPLGSIEVPLTPYRSIATDLSLFPRGALVYLETEIPTPTGNSKRKLTRFVLNQDAGGAIRGTDRADLFVGRGQDEEAVAGQLKSQAKVYFLMPKECPYDQAQFILRP